MPHCRKAKAFGLALLLWLGLAAKPATADLDITLVHSEILDNSVLFTAVFDTGLNDKVIEAIEKGIPVEIVVDVMLEEHRRILWDANLMEWELRRRIQYHALPKQYMIHGFGIAAQGFDDLRAALKSMGELRDIKLAVQEKIKRNRDYRLYMRARLDIESLPPPLRPVAYTSSAWRLNSGWKKWRVGY